MRRKDIEVTDKDWIFSTVENCAFAHIGMVDGKKPYVVAMNFGYERLGDALVLYFHSAFEDRKIDILKANAEVFVQMECGSELKSADGTTPCKYSYRFQSVTASGTAEFVEDEKDKRHALNCIMRHYNKETEEFPFAEASFQRTCVFRVVCIEYVGGRHL